MNKEHTETLWKLAPILYAGKSLSLKESLVPFGFECGDGWYWPLRRLSVKLEGLNIMLAKYDMAIMATQIKEKFATLHFYFNVIPINAEEIPDTPENAQKIHEQEVMMEYANEMAEEYIAQAEKECMEVCEDCGTQFYESNPRVMTTGWMNILCKECAEKTNRSYVLYPDVNKDPFEEDEKKVYIKKEEEKQ